MQRNAASGLLPSLLALRHLWSTPKAQESWDKYEYTADLEHDIHGRQTMSYEIMQHLNRDVKDIANI